MKLQSCITSQIVGNILVILYLMYLLKKRFEIWLRYNSLKLVTEQFLVVLNKFFLGTSYYNFFQLYLI